MKLYSKFMLVVLLTACIGLGINAAEKKPIYIGHLVPLTGASAYIGEDMARGADLAADLINEAGGVLGRPLEIINGDTESNPKGGMDAVHRLVDIKKVPVVLGAYSSSVSLATGAYTNKQKVVQITIATSEQAREVGPYFFDIAVQGRHSGTAAAKMAMKDGNAKRIAVLVPNNAYGLDQKRWMVKYIKEHGGTVTDAVAYNRGQKSYRSEITRLFAHDPQAVLYTAYGVESKIIMKEIYQMGLKPPKGFYASFVEMSTEAAIPETVDGVKGLSPAIAGPGSATFRKRYREKYGFPPKTCWSASQYDAVWLAAMAMNFAHSTDPTAIKDALFKVAPFYAGAFGGGKKTFDQDGMQVAELMAPFIYDAEKGEVVPYEYEYTPEKYE